MESTDARRGNATHLISTKTQFNMEKGPFTAYVGHDVARKALASYLGDKSVNLVKSQALLIPCERTT